ncbi:MAG: tetratricopeptide repeat protein, partial [Herminiimonas sp.]|nr:tetratricopeptide repeat protein [Herminiimonas sp.]
GGVLLITDGIDAAYDSNFEKSAKHLAAAGHRLSIMGIGTEEGAPIPNGGGGFLKSDSGSIVLPRLDQSKLNAVAAIGRGTYRTLSNDNSDINALLPAVESSVTQQTPIEAKDMKSDQWQDEGPWLLLPLLVLGAFAFRRGYWMFVLVILLQPLRPVEAMDWNSLWQNADQRGQQALAAQQPKEAAKLFNDPNWRAVANYKAGNYQASLDDLKSSDSAQALYNRGNALAKSGQLGEAIAAYDAALKKDPKLGDAKFNRDLLKKIQEQQKQNEQNKSSQSKDEKKDESSQQNDSPQQNKDQKPSDQGKDGDKKDGKQQDANKPNDASKPPADKNASDQKKSDGKQPDQAQNSPKDAGNADRKKAEDAKDKVDKTPPADKPDGRPVDKKDDKQNDKQATTGEDKLPSKEQQQADKQWLQRIPDDPGGLWRNKFLYQYKQNGQLQDRGKQSW